MQVVPIKFSVSEKMGGVKVRTTHKLSTDVFNSIVKLGSGLKKKKKKGKKVLEETSRLDRTESAIFIALFWFGCSEGMDFYQNC